MLIDVEAERCPIIEAAARILQRELAEYDRPNARRDLVSPDEAPAITLFISNSLLPESFQIIRRSNHTARIVGGDARGVLYGCGRFLRGCRFGGDGVQFPQSEGPSVPGKAIRGMYFAVHMHNFYHTAPIDEVVRYIEELALWGINTLAICYHLFHFNGIGDPACDAFIQRLNAMYTAGRAVGMKTLLLVVANDGYLNSPEELRYVGDVPRNWGTELCPSKPGAMELIRSQFEEAFARFAEVDYLCIWPYDSGGCLCPACAPWGANGFYKVADAVAEVFRRTHPHAKIILSTWMLDYNTGEHGEWDALYQRLKDGRLGWVDSILADGAWVNGYFPQRVLDEAPGRPVLSFLEISMRSGFPWGGFGANPMPHFIEGEWRRVQRAIEGGIPYSEGIFEDINKFIWSQLCWSPERSVRSILEEYASHAFSPEYAGEIAAAIEQIENAGQREPASNNRVHLPDVSLCRRAWKTLEKIDRAIPLNRRRSWRWRLLLLRAFIDAELADGDGAPTAPLGRALDELIALYHVTSESLWYVRPEEVELDPADGKLRFVQNGPGLSDICSYRKEVDEIAIARA